MKIMCILKNIFIRCKSHKSILLNFDKNVKICFCSALTNFTKHLSFTHKVSYSLLLYSLFLSLFYFPFLSLVFPKLIIFLYISLTHCTLPPYLSFCLPISLILSTTPNLLLMKIKPRIF